MEQPIASRAAESARAAFIRRTYAHLAGAILAFVALELLLFKVLLPDQAAMTRFVQGLFGHPASMLVLLVAFIGVGWLASMWAQSDTSRGLQYLGLGVYVVLQAIIFLPILTVATYYVPDGANIIPTAGVLTLGMFAGLTLSVFITGKDFSFLGPILSLAMWIAIAFVIAGLLFHFTLGLVFSFAMVALASGFILYDTSNVIHRYRTDQHVAASLALFASVALLFFYILDILIRLQGGNRD
jgi:FtsH-binding integral membrane protein